MILSLRTHRISSRKLDRALLHYCPAIVELNGSRFIVYRCQNSLRSCSWLAVSRLTPDYRVDWTKRMTTIYHTAEDPRAAVVNGEVYVFYQSGCTYWPKIGPMDWTVRCAKYDAAFNLIYDRPLKWSGRRECEKNLNPFFNYETGKWFCIYSVNPWRVLEFDGDWNAKLVYEKDHAIPWKYGEVRGGSCPMRVLPPVGKFVRGSLAAHYWAFFHSSYDPPKVIKTPRIYVGLLMSFSADFPFPPTGISCEPVLWPDPKSKTVVAARVAYPAGSILDGDQWTVSYGEGDCACKIALMSHSEIIDHRNFQRVI